MTGIPESAWEQATLDTLAEPLLWQPLRGEQTAPGSGERETWDELLIRPRLLSALQALNATVPLHYLQQAASEIAAPKSQDAITENHRIHEYLVGGVSTELSRPRRARTECAGSASRPRPRRQ